jgi:hypothetical protein
MRRRWKSAAVGIFVVALFGCTSRDDDEVDRQRCEKLRDHMVDLRVADIGEIKEVDIAAHRAALKQALGDSFIASCQQALTAPQITCSLAAKDSTAALACSSPPVASK